MKIRSKRDAGEAIQWTGKNTAEVMRLVGDEFSDGKGTWIKQRWNGDEFAPDYFLVIHHDELTLAEGDWLIKSLGGGLRAVSAEEFACSYESTP